MNKKNISFSIIIPTYNHADFLLHALQSVIQQKHNDWEVLIIDNHSADNTDEVIKKFKDSRIKTYKINNNGVIAASRNLGIKLATKEWVAFLDSDDKWYPNKLLEAVKVISTTSKYDVITTDEYKVFHNNKKKRILHYGPLPKDAYKFMLTYGNRLSPSATIVKNSFLQINNIKFNEEKNFITVEDYDFWLQLAIKNAKFKFLPSIQGEYLLHISNNSSQQDINSTNNECLLRHHVFSIQKFEKNKNKLWNKIRCRLEIHYALNSFSEKGLPSFLKKIVTIFLNSPLNSFFYLSVRLFIKCRKYFSFAIYKLSK